MARRGENIYKRKDKRWEGRYISGYNAEGKAVYKSVYAQSYAEVKEKLILRKNSKKICEQVPINNSSFGYFADEWLLTVKMKRKISTYSKYRNLYNKYISPVIGNMPVININIGILETIIEANEGLSSKTQNDIFSVVRMIINFATDNGCAVPINLKKLRIRQKKSEVKILSQKEQKEFTKYLLTSPDLKKIGIFLTLCTGLRIGELCALKKEDISFSDNVISVNKTMQRVQVDEEPVKTKIIIDEPKSQCSKRVIPIPRFAAEVIFEFYGSLDPNSYLLTGECEKFTEPRSMEYYFKKCVKESGIQPINFHALRHTFATRCVESGFDVKTLSEILGHANVNITLNRYVHSSLDLKRINMERLACVF